VTGFFDAMVAWGSETAVRQRVQAHLDAGVSQEPLIARMMGGNAAQQFTIEPIRVPAA
jgi:hypothetical protein